MSTPRTTAEEKVTSWAAVFEALRAEITPPVMRQVLDKMTAKDPTNIPAYVALARLVTANDRAAALCAAMLVAAGVKPVIVEGLADDLGD